jgi:hypothetical protein
MNDGGRFLRLVSADALIFQRLILVFEFYG